MFAPLIHFYPGASEPPPPSPGTGMACHALPSPSISFTRCPGPPHFDSRSLGIATTAVPDTHLALDPKRQRWSQLPDGSWIGVALDPLPDPDLFLRPDPLPGVPVTLGDRQLWILPRVNPAVAHDLPTQRRLAFLPPAAAPGPAAGGAVGAWHAMPLQRAHTVLEILPAFADLADHARRLADLAVGAVLLEHAAALSLPDDELVAFLSAVIAVNYPLNPDEVLALGLFSPDTDAPALLAVLNFPAALAAAACPGGPPAPPVPAGPPIPAEVPNG